MHCKLVLILHVMSLVRRVYERVMWLHFFQYRSRLLDLFYHFDCGGAKGSQQESLGTQRFLDTAVFGPSQAHTVLLVDLGGH